MCSGNTFSGWFIASTDASKVAMKVHIEHCPSMWAAELSLGAARALLDEHHYGLAKVKQRIVQFLAVRRLRGPEARAPILCFGGPPGVGKTSLARSVAQVRWAPSLLSDDRLYAIAPFYVISWTPLIRHGEEGPRQRGARNSACLSPQ